MKLSTRLAPVFGFAKRAGLLFLKTHILTCWVGLCGLGYFIGTQARPEPNRVPYQELFENMVVRSYREAPSDTASHFVVELTARGKPFRRYDVDACKFIAAPQGHEYWRSINGSTYAPLKVRGHVDRGVWLELPDSSATSLVPEQFDELYSSTLDLVNPVTVVTSAVGLLSGYSVGYRLAVWGHSLSSPEVQERVLATPGLGRRIAREAWRRVALEPAVVLAEKNSGRFASLSGKQRLYANFFKVAVNDSNGFIPYEVTRLEEAGAWRESRAMFAFATAVRRAAQDTCDLTSRDFGAVEEWASLLDRRGHWAIGSVPPPGDERIRYLGALTWFGLTPDASSDRRLWVGPRLIVRNGEEEGFVADEIPRIAAACPLAWRPWMGEPKTPLGSFAWTARWMGEAKQFAPILDAGANLVGLVSGKPAGGSPKAGSTTTPNATASTPSAPTTKTAPQHAGVPVETRQAARPDSVRADSTSITIEQVDPDAGVIRASFGAR